MYVYVIQWLVRINDYLCVLRTLLFFVVASMFSFFGGEISLNPDYVAWDFKHGLREPCCLQRQCRRYDPVRAWGWVYSDSKDQIDSQWVDVSPPFKVDFWIMVRSMFADEVLTKQHWGLEINTKLPFIPGKFSKIDAYILQDDQGSVLSIHARSSKVEKAMCPLCSNFPQTYSALIPTKENTCADQTCWRKMEE